MFNRARNTAEEKQMNAPMIQVGELTINPLELPKLLNRYQMMSQIWRGVVIDKAIADISCKESERAIAIQEFEQRYRITSIETTQTWLQNHGMSLEEMEELAIRNFKICKFKKANFSNKVDSYFLKIKANYDRVIYSLIRTKDKELASEIYFRIQGSEQSFAELAREYSQGLEADTGGIIGPVTLAQTHPNLAKILTVSKPGQLWTPNSIEGYFVVVRLEKLLPARIDDIMRRKLLDELFDLWVNEQVRNQVSTQVSTQIKNVSNCDTNLIQAA
jgi:parvulin-like peptidyl-prolyl isomerase